MRERSTAHADGCGRGTLSYAHCLLCSYSLVSSTPQSGTLRYNLDPFDGCTDAQLWSALEAVQLKKMVAGLKDGLMTEMAEFGSNFSVRGAEREESADGGR